MDNLIYHATVSLPQVVVTEPSPVSVQSESVVSVVRKIESSPEGTAYEAPKESEPSLEHAASTSVPSTSITNGVTSNSVQQSLEQTTATSGANANFANGEIVPPQACIVSVPEGSPSQQPEEAASTLVASQSEQDYYFGATDEGCCANCGSCTLQCLIYYQKAWDMIHSRYALPIWLLLLALPLSAGYMGALYMYSCPACHSLPMLKFLIGICLMAQISFRICQVIRIITIIEGESWGSKLHVLLLASTFLTLVFFVTEAMLFWQLETTTNTHSSTPKYCDPNFVTYSFWWNCVMSVVMVLIFVFPA